MTIHNASEYVQSLETTEKVELSWGKLSWLIGNHNMPEAKQTFGIVTIHPNERNPLHSHPNCEELLYVISGECDHKLGDDIVKMKPGSVIRIPQGVPHWAKCTSEEPVVAVISFSSVDRKTVTHEGDEIA
ncbi:cupin domain-containing protein [Paenibacillus sp. PAMC21692]|uniref:cupin domain-containing protein n=1 Tax=Paenibacillus sp. PAMC21692 TaxID=2762320 RepID=UPI00164CE978|nr:cupin domain-containing protein [Paenibacillus sp. PAMC21692]QNK57016.1 cupin domain-containing protein [Paenibacillus sp. PAMC21692]